MTNDAQTPRTGKLQDARFNQGDFVFVLSKSDHQTLKQDIAFNPVLVDIEYWKSIQASDDAALYQSYLDKFPKGHFSDLAQLKLNKLKQKKTEPVKESAAAPIVQPTYQLVIQAVPSDAIIRIMNIKQKYHPNIRLQSGLYHIDVSKPGFKSYQEWVKLESYDLYQSVELLKLESSAKPSKPSVSSSKAVGISVPDMVRIPDGLLQIDDQTIALKAFLLGKHEIMFSEFDAFCSQTGRGKPKDKGWGRGSRPVIYVNYEDASAYAAWLSLKTGKIFRLPSETEWLYAAQAGATTRYPWGDAVGENHANCVNCNSVWKKQTAPVGSFQANAFGLYDMQGNVWEWTSGCWRNDFSMLPKGGEANITGNCFQRSLRGGSWHQSYSFMKASSRWRNLKTYRSDTTGFRLVQEITR